MGSIPTRGEYLLKFTFPFLSGVQVKRGVEFCHSTRNVSIIRQKVGNRVSYHLVPSAYPAVCGIQREAEYEKVLKKTKLKFILFYAVER